MSSEGALTESLQARDIESTPTMAAGSIVFDKYRVERCIGRGGMGEIYEATHTTLGSRVALKLPLTQARSGSSAARLLREAQVAASLDPERVVRVLDVGILRDGRPALVLELLEGHTLADRLSDEGALEVTAAVDFVVGACLGLVEAHTRKIVHRDIKPSNLFIARRRDGTTCIKVLDFGIAALRDGVSGDVRLTDSKAPVGSPPYMAPEQLRGREVDARTDVWALGVTLFELLCGQRPFDGPNSAAIAAAIVADPPSDLRVLRPEVPVEIAKIVDSCLSKDPPDRPETALALAQALAPFATSEVRASTQRVGRSLVEPAHTYALGAREPSTPSQLGTARDPTGASPKRTGLLGLAVAVAVLMAVVAVIMSRRERLSTRSSTASAIEEDAPSARASERVEAQASAPAPSLPPSPSNAPPSPDEKETARRGTAEGPPASPPPRLATTVARARALASGERPSSSATAAPTAAPTPSSPRPIMDQRRF